MRIGIIDCGTNTFNLLIADFNSVDDWQRVFQNSVPVKLTPGGSNKAISISRVARATDAIFHFKQNITNFRVEKVYAFATSAFRSSVNGEAVRDLIKQKTGIEINIISGEDEAELIYQGVRLSGLLDDSISLIMDIGGGSTEFILATEGEIKWKASFPIGVSRIFNKLNPGNPMSESDVLKIREHVKNELGPLIEAIKEHKPMRLIGTAGSFNSLVRMIYPKEDIIPRLFINNRVKAEDFKRLYNVLISSTLEERVQMEGLRPYRAAYIPIAVIKVDLILELTGIDEIHQTPNALKEGVLLTLHNNSNLE